MNVKAVAVLEVVDGALALNGTLLIYSYPAGDHDTIPWPLESPWRDRQTLVEQLHVALLDCVETGELPSDTRSVLLPDGRAFGFRVPVLAEGSAS